jgi:hypothetical protein
MGAVRQQISVTGGGGGGGGGTHPGACLSSPSPAKPAKASSTKGTCNTLEDDASKTSAGALSLLALLVQKYKCWYSFTGTKGQILTQH